MKKCSKCTEEKPLEAFQKRAKNLDGYTGVCKTCKQDYDNKFHSARSSTSKLKKYSLQVVRNKSIKLWYVEYMKDKKCNLCEEDNIAALDFDHINNKSFTISTALSGGYSIKKILLEIQKCTILCSNCHRKKTAKDFSWYKYITK